MSNEVKIQDLTLRQAAEEGMDAFVDAFVNAIHQAIGGQRINHINKREKKIKFNPERG